MKVPGMPDETAKEVATLRQHVKVLGEIAFSAVECGEAVETYLDTCEDAYGDAERVSEILAALVKVDEKKNALAAVFVRWQSLP